MLRSILFLRPLGFHPDIGLLALRLLVGSFLMWETLDNVLSAERMAEFVGFVGHHGFIMPELMAPLSVYAQFICGALILVGALTRLASFGHGVQLCGGAGDGPLGRGFPQLVAGPRPRLHPAAFRAGRAGALVGGSLVGAPAGPPAPLITGRKTARRVI